MKQKHKVVKDKGSLEYALFSDSGDTSMSLQQLLERIKKPDAYYETIMGIRRNPIKSPCYKDLLGDRPTVFWDVPDPIGCGPGGILYLSQSYLTDALVKQNIEKLKSYNFVVAAWMSLDGTGLECLVRCEGYKDHNQKIVWDKVCYATGINFDEVSGGMYLPILPISYDPKLYYNLAADNFKLSRRGSKPTKKALICPLYEIEKSMFVNRKLAS